MLAGTVSIEKSEHLSARLKRRGIRHEILNAKNHQREASTGPGGARGAVTIATNMAGRGTASPGEADLEPTELAYRTEWAKEMFSTASTRALLESLRKPTSLSWHADAAIRRKSESPHGPQPGAA